jgi:CheY-like chemotaxis protein
MKQKTPKAVLIVDDEKEVLNVVRGRFLSRSREADCPYLFDVAVAESAAACIALVRDKDRPFDVVVFDICMETERSGLLAARALSEQMGGEVPVKIFLTGRPELHDCVEAMRQGAWDFIIKRDENDVPMGKRVVNSALARLRQLDLQREHEQLISAEWLPEHLGELQARYPDQFVALWHQPEVRVIASGRDAFELEETLAEWRQQHEQWEEPVIVQIPALEPNGC